MDAEVLESYLIPATEGAKFDKFLDKLMPQRVFKRNMDEMKTKQENWRQFESFDDTKKISIILSWLKSNGYTINPNFNFDSNPHSIKRSSYEKTVKVDGVNVCKYGFGSDNGKNAIGFKFATIDGRFFSVDIGQFGLMEISWHEYATDHSSWIHEMEYNREGRYYTAVMKKPGVESYLITTEPANESAALLGAICIAAIGIGGAALSHKNKVKNRKTRQEVEEYLQSKGVDGSDASIRSYQDKLIAEMLKSAASSVQKIISNAKFKAESEKILYENIRSERARIEEYDDSISQKKWCNYSKGMLRFKLAVSGMHHDALVFVDPNSPLLVNLFREEDNDDNAPGYFDNIAGSICEDIGHAVCAGLERDFTEDIGAGLVELEYQDIMGSPWGAPAIQLHAKSIPGRNGKFQR